MDDQSDLPWGERLRQWREETRRWTQQELVDQVVNLAHETKESGGAHFDTRLLSRWENGTIRWPKPIYRRLLIQLGAPEPQAYSRKGYADSPPESTAPRTLLEQLIRDSDRSIEEHCKDFEHRARELKECTATLSTRQLARWMAGEVNAGHPASRRVAKSLWGHDFRELIAEPPDSPESSEVDPVSFVSLPTIPTAPIVPEQGYDNSCASAEGLVSATSDEGVDLRRRDILGFAGGMAAERLLVPMEHTRRLVDSALRTAPSESDTEEWEHVADEYSRLVGSRVPIATVLDDLLTDFDEIRVRIEAAPEKLRNRLVRVAALLGALIAISLLCTGRHLEAARYWRTAQRAADSVGDPRLACLIRGRRAIYELYQRVDGRRTLSLADSAVGLAGSGASVGKASALAARAQILAMNGAGLEAMESLSALESDFERLPESVPANDSSQWSWSEQRLRFVQSFVHSYTGNAAEAHSAQEAALPLYPPSSYRGPVQIDFHRAIAMIVNGDQFGGAQCVLAALETVPAALRTDRMIRQPASFALDMVRDSALKLRAKTAAQELIGDPSVIR